MCFHAVLLVLTAAQASAAQVLSELEIEGNQTFTDREIVEVLTSETSRAFSPADFQADLLRVRHFYRRKGFHQAEVEHWEARPCGGSRNVCALIRVREGDPTRVSGVTLRIRPSQPPLDEATLLPVFAMGPGQIFDHDLYVKGKNAVVSHLRQSSYAFATIRGQAAYNRAGNSMALTLEVAPGTAARFGEVTFDGLGQIRPQDARGRLPIRGGEAYDPDLVEDSETLLADLDLFRSIEPELRPRPGEPAVVDVVFHVREKKLRALQFGAGFALDSSRQEARMRGQWTHRNFHNHLRTFSVMAEPAYAVIPSVFRPEEHGPLGSAEAALRQPAFLHPRQNLRTAIGFDSDIEQGYRWEGPRLNGTLERRITRRLSVSGGYTFRYLRFHDVDIARGFSSALVPPELLFAREYRLGYLDQRLTWDGRDHPLYPNRGSYVGVGLAESLPVLGSAFTYFKYSPELRNYLPLAQRATFASRVILGQMFARREGSPTTERFYLGGATSHRGFGYRRLSPQAATTDGRTVPVGGEFSFLISLEQRVGLFTLGGRWITGAAFLDAGDVVTSMADFDIGRLHYAIGPGLRYDTIVGLIRLDAGFRLSRYTSETNGRPNPDPGRRFAFHLSLGEPF